MSTLIEKILTLRTVAMFSGAPDEILAEVASVLDEEDLDPGDVLFNKGDAGDCMYIISSGRLRVHDGGVTIEVLGEGQVVGEMAVIDAAPRLASVTALEETHIFRLDQDVLFELISDSVEVLGGILRTLSIRLRARVQELSEIQSSRAETLEPPEY